MYPVFYRPVNKHSTTYTSVHAPSLVGNKLHQLLTQRGISLQSHEAIEQYLQVKFKCDVYFQVIAMMFKSADPTTLSLRALAQQAVLEQACAFLARYWRHLLVLLVVVVTREGGGKREKKIWSDKNRLQQIQKNFKVLFPNIGLLAIWCVASW